MVSNETFNDYSRPTAMNPKKFAFWLGLVSIVMFFAALTSAYIVRKADAGWNVFELPTVLKYSTAVILLSSVTMHWSYLAAKKDELEKVKLGMVVTTILGIAFLVLQFESYGDLVQRGLYFTGPGSNVSSSFLYVITLAHAAHIVSGVIFLIYALIKVFGNKVHSNNMLMMESCTTYWHFLDLLWVYLYCFLLFS